MTDPKVTFMAIAEGLEPLEHAIIMTSCPQLSATQNVTGNMLPPMAVWHVWHSPTWWLKKMNCGSLGIQCWILWWICSSKAKPAAITSAGWLSYVTATPAGYIIELDDGTIYRKTLYLMVKTMVSCRFSLKPFQWMMMGFFRMVIGSLGVAKTPRLGARGLPDPVGRIQLQPQGSGILSFAKWRLRKAWCVKGRGPQFGI